MAKNEFIKTVTIIERYAEFSFPHVIAIFKTGTTGKKRLIKDLNNVWESKEINTKDFPSDYDEDKYIFNYINENQKRLKYSDSATDANNRYGSSLPSSTAAMWSPLEKGGKTNASVHYSNIDYLKSRTEIDKKYRQFNGGYYPPYWEILKEGGTSSVAYFTAGGEEQVQVDSNYEKNTEEELKQSKRSFNVDSYYLNNGAEIRISWSYNRSFVGGERYSNNWGDEMSPTDLGLTTITEGITANYEKSVQIWIPENEITDPNKPSFTLCTKKSVIGTGSTVSTANGGFTYSLLLNEEDFGFAFITTATEDTTNYYPLFEKKFWLTGRKTFYNRLTGEPYDRIFSTGAEDKDILKEVLRKWQQKYKNSRLQIATNSFGTYTNRRPQPTLEWLLPTQELITGSGASGSGASGASGSTGSVVAATPSEPLRGSFLFDVTIKDTMFNPEIGELTVIEKEDVDPFLFGQEAEPTLIDPEYSEELFASEEEQIEFNLASYFSESEGQDVGGVYGQPGGSGTPTTTTSTTTTTTTTTTTDTGGGVNTGAAKDGGGTGIRRFQKSLVIKGVKVLNGELPQSLLAKPDFSNAKIEKNAAKKLSELNKAYNAQFGKDIKITDGYRVFDVQNKIFDWNYFETALNPFSGKVDKEKGKGRKIGSFTKGKPMGVAAAPPGTSKHGWGQAIDIDNMGSGPGNKFFEWMDANAKNFGWVNPPWAKKAGAGYEPWHWEYNGSDLYKD
jgi:LAS superfamily LD-carboxypeptidase LdcB